MAKKRKINEGLRKYNALRSAISDHIRDRGVKSPKAKYGKSLTKISSEIYQKEKSTIGLLQLIKHGPDQLFDEWLGSQKGPGGEPLGDNDLRDLFYPPDPKDPEYEQPDKIPFWDLGHVLTDTIIDRGALDPDQQIRVVISETFPEVEDYNGPVLTFLESHWAEMLHNIREILRWYDIEESYPEYVFTWEGNTILFALEASGMEKLDAPKKPPKKDPPEEEPEEEEDDTTGGPPTKPPKDPGDIQKKIDWEKLKREKMKTRIEKIKAQLEEVRKSRESSKKDMMDFKEIDKDLFETAKNDFIDYVKQEKKLVKSLEDADKE